ncbi:hypothetical protein SSBR45G_45520 [Bradyrhizobium sp. SSBR45G]|nr:hypothetical protein SSBR45G_45520 [Bradyrhizobium sp. SSBR45G]GLH86962.1 hypothetical protein SSBR45R_44220 [Bradyrhizobium sp. SSBR45R]
MLAVCFGASVARVSWVVPTSGSLKPPDEVFRVELVDVFNVVPFGPEMRIGGSPQALRVGAEIGRVVVNGA